jgi:hypothetical protein
MIEVDLPLEFGRSEDKGDSIGCEASLNSPVVHAHNPYQSSIEG